MISLISIKKYVGSGNSRYTAVFSYHGKNKKVNFGDRRYDNYTIHKNDERKRLYLLRHSKNEDWNNPMSAGSLSRFMLWNKKTLNESIEDYKRRFSL
jgi:hypothetical protein